MYRKIIDVVTKASLSVQLPKEYLYKQIEVIAFELENGIKEPTNKDFNEAISFFDSLNVDMNNFKFDRNDANKR